MNIDLIKIFKLVLTLDVVVALKLNQPHIFTALSSLPKYMFNSLKQYKLLGGIPTLSNYTLVKTLLFEDQNYTELVNSYITNANIEYLVNSQT